jgi:uncharacterized protein YigA (DUF484 family)
MTGHARGVKQDAINDGSVTRYLETYPDFFERNAALLAKLRLPHLRESSATVSLVERQVEVLRDRNRALERKIAEFKDVARANEALANRIHGLSRRLIHGRTLLETIHAVETSLREDFDARSSVLLLFMEQARGLEAAAGRFLKTADPADDVVKSFESLLQSSKPRCGQIRDAQRDFLFGKDCVEIGSVALTPLGAGGALGLLAIGASDADRFHPAVSTEFLTRIGELLASALTRS